MEGPLCHFFQSGKFVRIKAEKSWNAPSLGTRLSDGRTKRRIFPTLGNPRLEAD